MPAYDLSALNMLIVDDNVHMRLILRQVLRTLGIRKLREAADGSEAIDILKKSPADIVITDWEMSPVDGVQFARFLRTSRDSPNPYIPIIMLTAHSEIYRVHQARDAGVSEYMTKPVSVRMLYGRLVNAVERSRRFIRSESYTGPCRRRSGRDARYKGPERRALEDAATAASH